MIKNIIVLVILATLVAGPIQALPRLPCTRAQVDQLTPDPENCNRFYECTLHGWVGNACQPELEFNPEKLYCDYPENVKCATEISVAENVLKLEPCIELDQLIPDPQNCSRFYECSLQGWVGFACYPGLEFNPVTTRCDYPENVNCPSNVEILEQVARNEPCIIIDQLKPDLKNCSRFYECIEAGYWVGEPCNVGLLFNPDTLLCDYPENVKCATEKQNDDVIKPPCGTENYNAMFPDPSNCNGYLLCTPSGLKEVACPANLRFNPVTLSCDWSWRVIC